MPTDCFSLPCRIYTIMLELKSDAPVSSFLSATLRGGFGITLRKLVCAASASTLCRECILRVSCVYARVFESSPLPGAPRLVRLENIPRPFVMHPLQDKNRLDVHLTLFGEDSTFLPYFIYTFNTLGKKGLGKQRIRFSVTEVRTAAGKTVFSRENNALTPEGPAEKLRIEPGASGHGKAILHFETPLVLRSNGQVLTTISGRAFVATLLRRLTNLNAFYGENPSLDIDPSLYLDAAETLIIESDMEIEKRRRTSTRQNQTIDYSGLVGTLTLKGDTGTLLPLLKAGEITGVGKHTVFGYGRYKVIGFSEK